MTTRSIASERRGVGPALRRACDIAAVVLAAPFVLLVVALLALTIKLDTPGPVLVSHARLGRGGRPIRLLKLRTMVRDAEERKQELMHLNVLPWPDFKIPNDPRITRVGRWLRRTSLDEIPQLWNLARGDLTLVGPRPCSIGIDRYALWQTERLEAVPGLFGRWQAEARGKATFEERCRMDIAQIRTRTIAADVKLAAQTVRAVVRGQGAS